MHGSIVRPRLLALTVALAAGARADAQAPATELARTRLALADSDYSAGNRARAEREYRAVLQADPSRSRAVYQLAQLTSDGDEAVRLLRQYVALEPRDPWGHIALGDALARAGDLEAGLAAYDVAERLAPAERDVHVGRARLLARARRTERAIAEYERWTATHAADAEAWRELGAQRARAGRVRSAIAALVRAQAQQPDAKTARRIAYLRATIAPAVQSGAGGSLDSDLNRTVRIDLSAESQPGDAWGATIASSATSVGDGVSSLRVMDAQVALRWRPTAAIRLEGSGGGSFTESTAASAGSATPAGSLRLDWRQPGGGSSLNVRVSRSLVAASPLLVLNRVVRDEVAARADLEIAGPIRLRGIARASDISSLLDDNQRTLFGGGVVAAVSLGELAATVQQLEYSHPTTSGYFAPRAARIAELGVYTERESDGGVRLALDAAAGAQTVTNWGQAAPRWTPAYRAWGELALPLAPGRELRLEVEWYDAKIGSDVATSGTWSYGSARLGVRWALR